MRPTLAGQRLGVSTAGGVLRLGEATVVTAELRCENGVIHVVDRVILPELRDLATIAVEAGTDRRLGYLMLDLTEEEAGFLWLKRTQAEETEREMLETRVYRVLEDGIPMWLRTEIELSVAGKSREEVLTAVMTREPRPPGPE